MSITPHLRSLCGGHEPCLEWLASIKQNDLVVSEFWLTTTKPQIRISQQKHVSRNGQCSGSGMNTKSSECPLLKVSLLSHILITTKGEVNVANLMIYLQNKIGYFFCPSRSPVTEVHLYKTANANIIHPN